VIPWRKSGIVRAKGARAHHNCLMVRAEFMNTLARRRSCDPSTAPLGVREHSIEGERKLKGESGPFSGMRDDKGTVESPGRFLEDGASHLDATLAQQS